MLRGVATNGPAPPQVEESRLRYRFIVPDLRGPSTGGTVYNARLLAALCEMKLDVRRVEGDEIRAALTDPLPCHLWVDSLCLDILPCCRETGVRRHAVGLLTHYLPSLVKRGAPLQRSQLGLAERFAIDAADAFLVTSEFMRITVMNLLTRIRPVFVVEPGQFAQGRAADAPFATRVSAIMVANLLPGKGVNRFLRELARQVHEDDNFTIRIVGSMTLDADCARACERIVRAHPILSKSIEFAGPRSPSEVVEDIATSYLFVSASMMESYGMAIAEARTLGVPILAVEGGNVEQHVDVKSGGELVRTHSELARKFLGLCRNSSMLAVRIAVARARARSPRNWEQAARDFVRQALALEAQRVTQVQ